MANGDIYISSYGFTELISGIEKAEQDLGESLLTVYNPSEDYGSELADLDKNTILVPKLAIQGIVSQKVREAVLRLIRKQTSDKLLTKAEEISEIESITVRSISVSQALFVILVRVAESRIFKKFSVPLKHVLPDSLREELERKARLK